MNINNGPYSIKGCNKNDSNKYRFRKFTQLYKEKAIKANTYQNYSYFQINKQLCLSHYLSIVEADRNKNKKRKSEEFNEIYIKYNNIHVEFEFSHFLNINNNDKLNFNYWSNINIEYYNDKVIFSKNNFDILINKIKEMQKNINKYKKIEKNNLNQLKEKISLLSKYLYKRQRQLQLEIKLDPKKF